MSAEEKSKLDDIFKSGLGDQEPRFEYNEQDWDHLEQLLDAEDRPRGFVFRLWPVISGVAALLLLAFGWWFLKPADDQQNINKQANAVKHSVIKPPASSQQQSPAMIAQTKDVNPQSATTHGVTQEQVTGKATTQNVARMQTPVYASARGKYTRESSDVTTSGRQSQITDNTTAPISGKTTPQDNVIASTQAKPQTVGNNPATNATAVSDHAVSGEAVAAANTPTVDNGANNPPVKGVVPAQPKRVKVSNPSGFKPTFGLAMMLSPDVNGVGSFQNARVGTNVGLLFSVGFGKKLSITTGAAYSKKPYNTPFANYHAGYKFKTNPEDVYADCRVLDIPLNVDYKFYNKNRNAFSIGTGLSSYLMLKEKYTYDYADPNAVGPQSFTVINKNRHFLGVLNINATYERELNNRFSLAAQPYLKIPLTGIGNSQVKLQSAGVALGVRWNINH